MTTELDVAKAIRSGELSSPQQYENLSLFDVRVTGTGMSYREGLDEYVWRPPERFLTDEFLERCNGLPVIFEHPGEKTLILNTEEYRDRAIGTLILPYIKGDEVWGIAKVYDADAAALMQSSHASTSPAVVFRDAGSTETILVDGKTVLVEGDPSLLDHLAICEVGVWDKGGEPNGVNNGESNVDENEVPAWADSLIKRVDAACSRLDSIENKGGDKIGEEVKADSEKEEVKEAEKDGEKEHAAEKEAVKEGEKEKAAEEAAKADSAEKEGAAKADARADAQAKENAALKAQIAAMEARMNVLSAPLSTSDRDALSAAQARADGVAQMFGDSASAPLAGESPVSYRKRLAAKFQKHSESMKGVKLDSVDGAAFDLIEDRIYADAQSAALKPEALPAGRLIAINRQEGGRTITEFKGDMDAWLGGFKASGAVVKFNRAQKGA
ncbi:NUDIX hydrolase [Robbsia andropogonis]|uniref:NUDIX hydrolase n=1 Tax=Robbsia andropogonis TaxID=28092 RepID=UPI002A6B8426|nr:NUDIX hydrolase [Robbsia andropogonis]